MRYSSHHNYPNYIGIEGNSKENMIQLDEKKHLRLHQTLDIRGYVDDVSGDFRQYINNEFIRSEQSIKAQYRHLRYFFKYFDSLEKDIKIAVSESVKKIVIKHQNQLLSLTHCNSGLVDRESIIMMNDYNRKSLYHLLKIDESLVVESSQYIVDQFDREIINNLSFHHEKVENLFIIPLGLFGPHTPNNQITIPESEKYMEIYIDSYHNNRVASGRRKLRNTTNGRFIFSSSEWGRRFELQSKYLSLSIPQISDLNDTAIEVIQQKFIRHLNDTILRMQIIDPLFSYDYTSNDIFDIHQKIGEIYGIIGNALRVILEKKIVIIPD